MPLLLKEIKAELAKDANKKGVTASGDPKHRPPSVISRNLSDYKRMAVVRMDRSVYLKQRNVLFSALVPSASIPGRKYKIQISFHNVVMTPNQTPESNVPIMVTAGNHTGKQFFYKIPTIAANPVKMVCSCSDFRHRFSHQLDSHDALIGNPIPYTRETDAWEKGGRPYANATNKVGMCKHVYSFILHLKAKGLIRER